MAADCKIMLLIITTLQQSYKQNYTPYIPCSGLADYQSQFHKLPSLTLQPRASSTLPVGEQYKQNDSY